MHFTVMYFCVWVTISLSCDVISLSETAPFSISNKTFYRTTREVSEQRDWLFKLSYRFEIWQAAMLPMCLSNIRAIGQICIQISLLRDFARDLTIRRLTGFWNGAHESSPTNGCRVTLTLQAEISAARRCWVTSDPAESHILLVYLR